MNQKIRVGGKKVKLTPELIVNIALARARAQGANAGLLKQDVQVCPYIVRETPILREQWLYGYNLGKEVLERRRWFLWN